MTKHDWFWVIVKTAGLIALAYALTTLVFIVTLLGDMAFGSILVRILFNVAAVGALGVWLIRDGKMLTDWARASDRDAPTGGA